MELPHEEAVMMGGNHSSMCKFGLEDKRFEAVWKGIRRAAKGPVALAPAVEIRRVYIFDNREHDQWKSE
jgi:hypothetical protein